MRRLHVTIALVGLLATAACTTPPPGAPTSSPAASTPALTATASAPASTTATPTTVAPTASPTAGDATPTPTDRYPDDGYGDDEGYGSGRTPMPGGSEGTVSVINYSTTGAYLAGPNRRALYTFDRDDPERSSCTDECAEAWPPLTVAMGEEPIAGPGLDGTLGAFQRADASWQVTYNGAPLYFFTGDQKLYDTTGDGLNGVWHLARP